jgi:hypothetical protein
MVVAMLAIAGGCNAGDQKETLDAKAIMPDGTQRALEAAEVSIADRAAAVLAEELDIPVSQVTVVSVRPVDWRDSSIGCPQPGQAYAQVITPGHKISLRARGQIYVLHEAGGKPFLCKRTKSVAELTPQRELAWSDMALEAREDLAQQLGVAPDQIKIADARRRRFDDAALECPEPGIDYPSGAVDGYLLVLRHGNRNYTYHTDLERVVACPPVSLD